MQKEINLKVLFDVIKRRLFIIFIITVITTIASVLYSTIAKGSPPIYQSSTSMLINMDGNKDSAMLEVILRDPTVLNKVIGDLGLHKTLDELNNQITFSNDGGSEIVKIMATDTNPELAANIANATANNFTKQVGNILGIYDTRILSEAQPNLIPFVESGSPSPLKYLVIGFSIGLILSIGIVFFLDSLDETIKTEREIEQLLGLPAIGYVSKMNSKNTKSINKKPID